MLLVDKSSIGDLCVEDYSNISYHPIAQEDLWRDDLINQTVDALWGVNTVEGRTRDELSHIVGYACAA